MNCKKCYIFVSSATSAVIHTFDNFKATKVLLVFQRGFFYAKTPATNSGANFPIIIRSVFNVFDCVGLTKPYSTSKLLHFCYLRFYAAILSNVAELTTLRKKAQSVFSQYLKWQLACKKSIVNQSLFCLVFSCEMIKKKLFFALPLNLRDI